eukprot:jgi/Mesen1/791/ME000110S_11058
MGKGTSATVCVVEAAKVEAVKRRKGSEDVPLAYITYKELQLHNTPSDCWVTISGKVYDLTKWLDTHPGGSMPILDIAGQDATEIFTAFHNENIWGYLPKFYIGELEVKETSPIVADYRKLLRELHDEGLFKTDMRFYYTILFTLASLFACVVAGVVFTSSTAVHMGCAVLLGLVWNQCSFIGHDAGHNGITKSRKIDSYIGLLAGNIMTGIGIAWWKSTHNVHHLVCNSLNYDPDVQHVPLLAISSRLFSSLYSNFHARIMPFDSVARAFVSVQHLTYYPIMIVARVNLYAQTLMLLCSRDKVPNRLQDALGVAAFWTWFACLLAALPNVYERLAFAVICHAMTAILHIQISLSHFPMPTYEGRPEIDTFVQTQLNGTLDVDCHPWLDWFHGGLQYQIEHHLFPRLPRHNLRQVTTKVQALCKKHNLPYCMEANKMLIAALRTAAMAARDLSKPAPKLSESIIWDAVNARG